MRVSIHQRVLALASCLAVAPGAFGCGDDDPTPTVTVLEITPDAIDTESDLADDVRILVEYYDGDGDLGSGHAEVHDCRAAELVTYLDIPPIASEEAVAAGVPIQGTLALQLTDVGTAPDGSAESSACEQLGVDAQGADSTVFCVILVDTAGNESVGDCTAAISVTSGAGTE